MLLPLPENLGGKITTDDEEKERMYRLN